MSGLTIINDSEFVFVDRNICNVKSCFYRLTLRNLTRETKLRQQ